MADKSGQQSGRLQTQCSESGQVSGQEKSLSREWSTEWSSKKAESTEWSAEWSVKNRSGFRVEKSRKQVVLESKKWPTKWSRKSRQIKEWSSEWSWPNADHKAWSQEWSATSRLKTECHGAARLLNLFWKRAGGRCLTLCVLDMPCATRNGHSRR